MFETLAGIPTLMKVFNGYEIQPVFSTHTIFDEQWFPWAGGTVTSGLGAFFHFLYPICNKSVAVALFVPVNESVWEHQKLIWFPMTLWVCILTMFADDASDWMFSSLAIITPAIATTICTFYIFTALNGADNTIFDICLYVAVMFAANHGAVRLAPAVRRIEHIVAYSATLFVLYFALFAVLTLWPIHVDMFRDGQTNFYGIDV
jgi:hypothetical protein